ncbi:MAG: hypothetical protein ACE5JU_19840 [Candidatus Binatia bacterium]
MLCIFKGPTPTNPAAGDVQSAVEAQVAPCEHANTVQERQDGCFDIQTRLETADEMYTRLMRQEGIGERATKVLFPNEQPSERVRTGETRRASQTVEISPALVKDDGSPVTLADFPDGWSFGNGVTCNAWVRLQDGSLHCMSWAVFPDADQATIKAKLPKLWQLMEG